jgi:hypothetical protein
LKEETYIVQNVSSVETVPSASARKLTENTVFLKTYSNRYLCLPISIITYYINCYRLLLIIIDFVDYSICGKCEQWDDILQRTRKANKQEIKSRYVQEVGVNTECILCNQISVSVFLGNVAYLGYSIRFVYCEN